MTVPVDDKTATDLKRFRAGFPGAVSGRYLNVADRGLISTEVKAALVSHIDACVAGISKEMASAWTSRARQQFAQLVRADESEIALVKNVSDGINAVATAIDWKPGDNVVLCEDLEHPSNLYAWYNLRERCGITIRRVKPSEWAIDPQQMIAAIDGRTRIVSVSMVTFAPGFRTDVAAIGKACRERDALFLVDAAQAVGVLDVDLSSLPIDALAVGTPKALLGLYGMGFLFVRDSVVERLRPAYLSGAGVSRSAMAAPHAPLPLKAGAGRLEVGNLNHLGCVAAAVSIGQLRTVGMARIEKHACDLARMLSDGFKGLGLPVLEPRTDIRCTNIVAVGARLEAGLNDTSDRRLISLHDFLKRQKTDLSIRRGVLRFSTHGYTDRDDVAQTLALASEWQKSRSGRA